MNGILRKLAITKLMGLLVLTALPAIAFAGADGRGVLRSVNTGIEVTTGLNSQPGRKRWRKGNRRGPYYGYRNYGQYRSSQNRRYRTVRKYYWYGGVRRYRYVRIYY